MNYDKYYEARDIVTEILKKDLLGPVTEDEIICKDRPLDYYQIGKLYPQLRDAVAIPVEGTPSEELGELDEEDAISLSNGRNPSSCGITFCIGEDCSSFIVDIDAARYEVIPFSEAMEEVPFKKDDFDEKDTFWKRVRLKGENLHLTIEMAEMMPGKILSKKIEEGLLLKILLHRTYHEQYRTITVSLVNEKDKDAEFDYIAECENAYFQPCISISLEDNHHFKDVRMNANTYTDEELLELEMLYSDACVYASGHGCAVDWGTMEGVCKQIRTSFLPVYEVRQMMPSTAFSGDVLCMKYLSEASAVSIINGFQILLDNYREWIDKQREAIPSLREDFQTIGTSNLEKCEKPLQRITESLNCLKDPDVYRAFQLANLAMFRQRKQLLIVTKKFTGDDDIRWYPFQIAFILQEISSLCNLDSTDRSTVDLLWFPTGGGKTEAYLGIAAFTIFLRRIREGAHGDGVTVLMRYTLRLLTFQQFERAAAMICACEEIRKEQGIKGGEIGIGLWAGRALTPNSLDKAASILRGEQDPDYPSSNPAQLEKCPWCHTDLHDDDYQCDKKMRRMHIRCSNPKCSFHNGLPVYLVDEEIYEHKPAFLIATIDKFAQIALNADTFNLFGIAGQLPPELIIQDELHLISGPLGTITGLYEAAITKLCERNHHKPKIIASTATIRNAREQIRALYGAEYTQFPPQGLNINNSFFAVLSEKEKKPARQYMGCMSVGTSSTTMMIRIIAALLYATRYLSCLDYPDEIIDKFWTLTGYFNSLRELGAAIVRVEDDIQDRFSYLRTKKFGKLYPLSEKCQYRYAHYKELTSRESSADIGKVIQKELPIEYKSDGSTAPFDIILSSNMISVGVDVGRLGTMVVIGQPKTTSEYIQATSRVGRETPGFVVTAYNQAKSRDRSHYEQFRQYHESFYKYVEATSVTPFADRARDRALQTLYVILCRYYIPELREDNDAVHFNKSISGLEKIRQYIYDYVKIVDPDELDNVIYEIEEIEDIWERKASRRSKLKYRNTQYTRKEEALFDPDFDEGSRFRVLNTMRSVETSVEAGIWE